MKTCGHKEILFSAINSSKPVKKKNQGTLCQNTPSEGRFKLRRFRSLLIDTEMRSDDNTAANDRFESVNNKSQVSSIGEGKEIGCQFEKSK